jgi:hypothetical protein
VIRAATFLGLLLVFPCPLYMVAVGGLLPLPVIASYGADGGLILAFAVVHVLFYAWIFYLATRLVGGLARRMHMRGWVPAVLILALLLGLGAAPIYGSGENLAAGNKLNHTAYEVYRAAYHDWSRGRRATKI